MHINKIKLAVGAVLLASVWGQAQEDTPVMFTDMSNEPAAYKPLQGSVPWRAPDYSKQDSALGYGMEAFKTPAGMESRVAFWKDIYTRYNTDQGVFHDSLYTNVIYEAVDFTDIMKDKSLTTREREKARRKRMEAIRETIRERLVKLSTTKSADGLSGEDLRYWNMFSGYNVEDRFKEAAVDGRLRFQLGQKDRFVQGIYQSGRYLAQMEQIFREEGVPVELTRLPFVESSFNLRARSRVGASGIWQFMRSSARQYLKMNTVIDERNDPLHATRAAAKKLRMNYRMLESWPLAVTAYNRGPSGVKRLVDELRTRNLPELLDYRKGRFGFASASFYASFLAALEVERDAVINFGLIYRMPEMRGTEIILRHPILPSNIVAMFDGNLELAKSYNPQILDRAWKGKTTLQTRSFVRVPEKVAASFSRGTALNAE